MKYCGADNYDISSADNGLVAPSVLGIDLASNVRSPNCYLYLNEVLTVRPVALGGRSRKSEGL